MFKNQHEFGNTLGNEEALFCDMRQKFRWEMSNRDFDDYLQGANFDVAFDTEEDWNQAILAENSYHANQQDSINYDNSQSGKKSNRSNSFAEAEEDPAQAMAKGESERFGKASFLLGSDAETGQKRMTTNDSPHENESLKMANIESQVDFVVQDARVKGEYKYQRTDVLNKIILRGFKRFISSLFVTGRRLPRRICDSPYLNKKHLLSQGVELGLVDDSCKEDLADEYNEFICWLALGKSTQKVRKTFSKTNVPINLLDSALKSYSHSKCQQLLENPIFKTVFAYFMQHGKEKFLTEQAGKRRDLEVALAHFY